MGLWVTLRSRMRVWRSCSAEKNNLRGRIKIKGIKFYGVLDWTEIGAKSSTYQRWVKVCKTGSCRCLCTILVAPWRRSVGAHLENIDGVHEEVFLSGMWNDFWESIAQNTDQRGDQENVGHGNEDQHEWWAKFGIDVIHDIKTEIWWTEENLDEDPTHRR